MNVRLLERHPERTSLVHRLPRSLTGVPSVKRVSKLAQAVDRLAAERFDVALVDLSSRAVAAEDPLRVLRQEAPSVPLIAITTGDEQGFQAVQAGAQEFVCRAEADERALLRVIRLAPPAEPRGQP